MTLDRRMRQAAESVRRYADAEVDPVAMLWRQRSRQRRRSLQRAAVALALLAGLVAAAVLVARGPRQPEVIAPPPRPLGRVAATVALPQAAFPRVVGVVDGLVWVDGGDATAYRVDPRSNRVAGSLRLPAGSRLAAVARGSLWLANEAAGTVSQADPRTGRILGTVRVGLAAQLGQSPPEEQFRLAVDGNTVWVARLHTDVVRLNWAAGKVAGRFTIGLPGSSSYDVIAAGSGLAVTHGDANDADQLDPRTGTATAIGLGGSPAGAAFGAGSFWVSAQNATLARIDPASRRVVATIRLDANHLPGAVVAGDGAVWVFAGGRLLQRIDPASSQVVHTLAVGPDGVDSGRLAVGAGSVWLSDADARTLIRIDTRG
jgi:streptogramin lyase